MFHVKHFGTIWAKNLTRVHTSSGLKRVRSRGAQNACHVRKLSDLDLCLLAQLPILTSLARWSSNQSLIMRAAFANCAERGRAISNRLLLQRFSAFSNPCSPIFPQT